MEKSIKIQPFFCKTCLSKDKELFNLSEQCDFNDSLENILFKCCEVLIDIPGVKNLICMECKHLLLTFYKFKELCKRSESTLLSFVNINVVNIEKLLAKESVAEINCDRFELKVLSEDELVTPDIKEEIKNDPLELKDLSEDLHIKDELIYNIGTSATEIENYEEYSSQIEGFIPPPQTEDTNIEFKYIELTKNNCEDVTVVRSIKESKAYKVCEAGFTDRTKMKEHWKSLSKEEYFCIICKAVFCSENVLLEHVAQHKTDIYFQCHVCSESFVRKRCLQRHIERHHDDIEQLESHPKRKEYFCIICKAVFYEESELLEHVAQHKADLYAKCHICLELFAREKGLQRHIERHHNGDAVQRKPRRPKSTKSIKFGNKSPITCPVCNETFLQYKLLAKHMKVHDAPISFNCDECGKSFAQLDNMEEHKKVHEAEKPYLCNICERRYEKKVHLNKHLKTH